MFKSNELTDDKFAKPSVYTNIYNNKRSPIIKVTIGSKEHNIKKSLIAGYVEISNLPARIYTQAEIERVEKSYAEFVDFRKKFPQASKLIAPYISHFEESLERIEQGDRRFSGKWISKVDLAEKMTKPPEEGPASEGNGRMFKTLSNFSFAESKILSRNLEGLRILTASGIRTVPWKDLAEEKQQALGLNQLMDEAMAKKKEAELRIAGMRKKITELAVPKKASMRSREKIKEALTLYAQLNKAKMKREPIIGRVGFTGDDIKAIFGKPDEVRDYKYEDYTDKLVAFRYKDYWIFPELGVKEDLIMIFFLESGFLDGVGLRGKNTTSQRMTIQFPE